MASQSNPSPHMAVPRGHISGSPVEITGGTGHMPFGPSDPENPQNWPFLKKVYASAVATAFGFTAAFGLTCYTAGITGVMKEFDVGMTLAILPFSIYFVGIAFAPVWVPHVSERVGRSPVYMVTIPIGSLFLLGAGFSKSFAALTVCRFFAGLFNGPSLVLIEGTFADVWHPDVTLTYYAGLSLASYIGAGCGPLIGGFVFVARGWRWTQYVPLMVALASYLFAIGVPETYAREIVRQRARRDGKPHNLPVAQSGVTLGEMVQVTVIDPVKMLITEPIIMIITLYVCFLFGLIFQFFILVPAVLMGVYSFTRQQAGLAFNAAIVGSLLAAATTYAIDKVAFPRAVKKSGRKDAVDIEYRLIPAMLGGVFLTASFFWIGWTSSPAFRWPSPVLGTLLFVWGNMMILISFISYLFDAYPPRGTLSGLTIAASLRLLTAGAIPLVIIQMVTKLGGGWALSTFGFIAAALMFLPFVLYYFGPGFRARSPYGAGMMMPEEKHEASTMTSHGSDEPMMGHSTV